MVRNVLLITIDSLRKDYVLKGDAIAPGLVELTDEGYYFDHAYSTGPGTSPAFPALLTGTYALSYGGLGPLSQERPRLARILSRQGFSTGGFHCNPFLSRFFNYNEGFHRFLDYQNPLMGIATKVFPRGIEINNPKLRRIDEVFNLTGMIKKTYHLLRGKPRPYVKASVIAEDAMNWLDGADPPFFCWAHFMDVHHPCYPPREYRKRFGVGSISTTEVSHRYSRLMEDSSSLDEDEIADMELLYRASISYTDDQVQRIIDRLKERELFDDTLIILTSDHGELFGEHGYFGKPARMYDELLRVPLIVVNGPSQISNAAEELVSLIDIPPTIHQALGIEIPDEYEGQLLGNGPREFVMAEHEVEGNVIVGVRSDRWLYEADEIAGNHRLYDYIDGTPEPADPDHPDAITIRNTALERLSTLEVEPSYSAGEMEGAMRERLEDLGYL